ADIDDDHDLDLLTGGWWQPVRIYLNNSGNFNTNPEYTSTSSSVVEVIVIGDVDKDAVQNIEELFVSDGLKKLFYLPRTPLQYLNRVIVGNDTLQNNEYCYDLENGWVMLATQPGSGTPVTIETAVSWDIDMGITNWDQNKGNYLFYNNTDPVYASDEKNLPEGIALYQNYPNPFNPSTKIKFTIPISPLNSFPYQGEGNRDSFVTLKVYDVLGNEVAALVNEEKGPGTYEAEFKGAGLPSGIYFYQLVAGSFIETKKMMLVK
ncbi:MAG: T9SS type A sorting domain-containing protein, partial [Ignavibacteriaceae bacterium]